MTAYEKRGWDPLWLAKALDTLAEDPEHLRVDEIARRLNVSKGSFYWHFEDRDDFVRSLVDYWDRHYTRVVEQAVSASPASASDRLLILMDTVTSKEGNPPIEVLEEKRKEFEKELDAGV